MTAALLAGCTTRNGAYQARDLEPPPPDLWTAPAPRDLAYIPPDLTVIGGSCSGTERGCVGDDSSSERCHAGSLVLDRICPGTSTCANGYCQPPTSGVGTLGQSCDSQGGPAEGQCQPTLPTDPTCAPFVSASGDPSWICAKPIGAGGPGTSCTRGSECRSGFCSSSGTCFRACQSDCPTVGGRQLRCATVTIDVEGQQLQATSCIP